MSDGQEIDVLSILKATNQLDPNPSLGIAIKEIDRLRAELAERESDMHLRIRATYDTTVANAWKEKLAEKDKIIEELERYKEGVQTCPICHGDGGDEVMTCPVCGGER